MVKPREALRTGDTPFRMVDRECTLHLPDDVFRAIVEALNQERAS
jgi:hypothetical protein